MLTLFFNDAIAQLPNDGNLLLRSDMAPFLPPFGPKIKKKITLNILPKDQYSLLLFHDLICFDNFKIQSQFLVVKISLIIWVSSKVNNFQIMYNYGYYSL